MGSTKDGFSKYLIVLFWYASAACQVRLVSSWVFWLDYVLAKHESWLDQTSTDMPPKRIKEVRFRLKRSIRIHRTKVILLQANMKHLFPSRTVNSSRAHFEQLFSNQSTCSRFDSRFVLEFSSLPNFSEKSEAREQTALTRVKTDNILALESEH